MTLAYAFEASSIQDFILDGGKLRDISGGSALIDRLSNYAPEREPADDLVEDVLRALPWDCEFARRGGGAFVLFAPDEEQPQLEAFRRLWTLTVQLHLPGLSFNEAIGKSPDDDPARAMQRAIAALQYASSQVHPTLPLTPPLARRDPRTGGPAATRCRITHELIDPGIQAKRSRYRDKGAARRGDTLTRKFSTRDDVDWPIRMDAEEPGQEGERVFPLIDGNSYVGVIHADGNRLGGLVREVQGALTKSGDHARFARRFRAFSQSIARATECAAAKATKRIGVEAPKSEGDRPVMRIRPIVLGGDDLTAIVRGDLAIQFTSEFLKNFVAETATEFRKLRRDDPALKMLPADGLSAGAGIAFVKSTQPFQLACRLAEDLARMAKARAKKANAAGGITPSCIAFHRITTAMIDRYTDIRAQELTFERDGEMRELSLNPYVVEPAKHPEFPSIEDLDELVQFLRREDVARGPLRLLARMGLAEPREAEQVYQRWRTVMEEADRQHQTKLHEQFDKLMCQLGCAEPKRAPWVRQNGVLRSPLLDALSLVAVSKGGDPTLAETEAAA